MQIVTPLLTLVRVSVYIFLIAPIAVVVLASFNAGNFLTFPPQGLSLRWFWTFLQNDVFIDAILYSAVLAACATGVSLVVGTMAALYFVRHARREAELVRIGVLLPLILPEILTAIALLFFFYEIGIGTEHKIALFTGHVLMTLPFVFLNAVTSLQSRDDAAELAARTLGASRYTAFRRITLPLIAPGVATGSVFAFIISFDTFGISFILKGSGSAPLPIQLYDYLRFNFTPEAAAVSTVSIIMTVLLLGLADLVFGKK